MNIGIKIRQIRNELELTQKEFALELDISDNYISLIESGKKTPSLKLLSLIHERFDIDLIEYVENIPGVKELRKKYSEEEIKSIILGLESISKRLTKVDKN